MKQCLQFEGDGRRQGRSEVGGFCVSFLFFIFSLLTPFAVVLLVFVSCFGFGDLCLGWAADSPALQLRCACVGVVWP